MVTDNEHMRSQSRSRTKSGGDLAAGSSIDDWLMIIDEAGEAATSTVQNYLETKSSFTETIDAFQEARQEQPETSPDDAPDAARETDELAEHKKRVAQAEVALLEAKSAVFKCKAEHVKLYEKVQEAKQRAESVSLSTDSERFGEHLAQAQEVHDQEGKAFQILLEHLEESLSWIEKAIAGKEPKHPDRKPASSGKDSPPSKDDLNRRLSQALPGRPRPNQRADERAGSKKKGAPRRETKQARSGGAPRSLPGRPRTR